MANLIQIKRSLTTAAPAALANGEQAYTSNGDVLYIGANGSVVAIGGARNPGVLTANQALVANSSSYIDVIKTANLYIGTATVDAINAVANTTHLGLAANNELPTTWAVKTYVDSSIAYTITNNSSNTQLLFNDSGIVAGDAGITYDKNTDTLAVAGTLSVNSSVTANASGVFTNGTVNGSVLSVGSVFVANQNGITVSNSAVFNANTYVNNFSFFTKSSYYSNSLIDLTQTGTGKKSMLDPASGLFVAIQNESYLEASANYVDIYLENPANGRVKLYPNGHIFSTSQANLGSLQTTTIAAGNTTITGFANVTGTVNAASHTVGTDFVANSAGVYTVGTVNGSVISVGSSFIANSTGAYHTGTVNAASLTVGSAVVSNASGVFTTGQVNAASLTVDSFFIANTTAVLANTNLTVNGNTTLGDTSADLVTFNAEVSSNFIPAANVTYNVGTNARRWNEIHAANVYSTHAFFEGSVSVTGDLVVSGNLTTVNVSSLQVQDPLIRLAGNNSTSDIVDIGFMGTYLDGANVAHAGLIRHAATDEFYIFKGYTDEANNNTIDVGNTSLGYVQGTLNAFLDTGKGFEANSTAVTITANSTVAVNITANSITLSTPLAATSGGTGQNTYSIGDLLVGGDTNTLVKLSLGTDGKVLQSNGSALVYSDLDGGVF